MTKLTALAQEILFLRSALTHARGEQRTQIANELAEKEIQFDELYVEEIC